MAILLKNIGDWERIIEILSKYEHLDKPKILRELGFALRSYYKRENKEYKMAETHLKKAIQLDPSDWDAMAILGGYYKDIENEDKARMYYKNAFDINPYDPYSLGNYLIYQIRKYKNSDPISISRSFILEAIERCNTQIDLDIDIPWAYYNNGLFNLFLGNFYESFVNYILGIRYSSHDWIVSTTFKSLNLLSNFIDLLPGLDLIKNLLLLSLVFKFKDESSNDLLKSSFKSSGEKMESPVVILIGTTRKEDDEFLNQFHDTLIDGFKNFHGTLISGGTKAGVTAYAGEIQEKYGNQVKTIGYLPKEIPSNTIVDSRYKEIRYTNALDFSIKEAISYWLDLWNNKISPRYIKAIGIGGGNIAKLEYYLALLFNIKLGILAESGRSADLIFQDANWEDLKVGKKAHLKILENNVDDIDFFVNKY